MRAPAWNAIIARVKISVTETLPAGKLPSELLQRLLSSLPADESVLIGPAIGRDAAAVRLGDRVLVLKSDPITFAGDEIGWYAVNVNANDLACLGATPRWMLATALLPEGSTTADLVERTFAGLRDAAAGLGVTLVGGHTEITDGVNRPILVGQMVGDAREEELIDPRRSRAGDAVILARGIAIEGTALVARELPELLGPHLSGEFVARCRVFLHDPGISVVPAAVALRSAIGLRLHALHDPTEGGLATGLRELGAAASLGIVVQRSAIPIYPETRAICNLLGLDPLGLIASGALLAVVDPSAAEGALSALAAAGIPAARIGIMDADPARVSLITEGREGPLPSFAVDEIARLFSEA